MDAAGIQSPLDLTLRMKIKNSMPSGKTRTKDSHAVACRQHCKGYPESITNAAIRLSNGSVYTGLFHGDALEKAEAARAHHSESYYNRLFAKIVDGFVTSKGRFVGPMKAFEIAVKSRQITAKSHAQATEDLWGPEIKAERWLSSLSFNNVRRY
jgi:hypothetical protein